MKLVAKGLTLAALLITGACTDNLNRPTDTGSMSTPTPYRAGVVDPAQPRGRDVGSMTTPDASGGVVVRQSNRPDVGSMQLPSSELRPSQPGRITP